jgi:meso-butanediol dehydrogenase/(S,S)-butanediol dehydrogenase/diacetyl reductase
MRFSGKVILVSGAGSGIGRATAEAFAAEGGRVALLGRTRSKLEEVAAGLPPDSALPVVARHENPADVARAVQAVHAAFGPLDVLVNNAGAYTGGSAGETSLEDWNQGLAVNLTGPYLLTQQALPHLRERHGVVINVASTLGLKPIPGATPYCVAKAGLIMLTRATALEEAKNGVRVNVLCPGVVDTPIHRQRVDDPEQLGAFLKELGKLHPLGRVGKPAEIAALVLFVASDASAWTTGAVVTIDGGILLG